MLYKRHPDDKEFLSVALAVILFGAVMTAFGLVEWLLHVVSDYFFLNPECKVIIGVIIIALGYILLELELIRKKK